MNKEHLSNNPKNGNKIKLHAKLNLLNLYTQPYLEAQHIRGHAECVAKAPAYLRCRRRSGCFAITVDGRSTRTGPNFRRIIAGTGPTTSDGHRIVHGGRRRGRRGDCRIERRGRQLVRFYRW